MNSIPDPKNWLPVKEVAYALRLSRHTILRLCEDLNPRTRQPYLFVWRPSPGTILISRESLQQYCDATRDPGFWAARKPRPRLCIRSAVKPFPAPAAKCSQPRSENGPAAMANRRRKR